MRALLLLLLVLALGTASWFLLGGETPQADGPGASDAPPRPDAPAALEDIALPVESEAQGSSEGRAAIFVDVLAEGSPIPPPRPGDRRTPGDVTEIRIGSAGGVPTGRDVVEAVSRSVLVRVRSRRDLDLLDEVPVEDEWIRDGAPIPIEHVFMTWRQAGFQVEDVGHCVIVFHPAHQEEGADR